MQKIFSIYFIFHIFSTPLLYANPQELSLAHQHFTQGKDAYYELFLDKALLSFKKAKELYEKNKEHISNGEVFFQSYVFSALCYFSQKEEDKAKEELKKAYRLNPQKELDPLIFSPEFIEFYKKIPFKDISQGTLEIHSKPPFAKVFINGFELGQTPLILDFPHGNHTIRMALENHTDWKVKINFNRPLLRLEEKLTFLPQVVLPKSKGISQETQKFLDAIEKNSKEPSSKKYFWSWPLAILAASGIAYGVIQHSRQKNESHPTPIMVNIP